MTTVTHAARIGAPIDRVFGFVTTARHWPAWHPATEAVSGDTDAPMRLGDRITERARIGGQVGEATWTVVEHEPNRRVVLALPGTTLGDLSIRYDFGEEDGAVVFRRSLTYDLARLPAVFAAAIDRQMETDSATAVERIRTAIEG